MWQVGPPRGTGTDDTRNNQIFVECVNRNHGHINSQLLAMEYIERYRILTSCPRISRAGRTALPLAYDWSCVYLGMRELPTGEPLLATSQAGNTYPMLAG